MRHRHLGPKVKYITRRGNTRYRQRPTHSQSLIRRHRPVRRFIRLADPEKVKELPTLSQAEGFGDYEPSGATRAFTNPAYPEDIFINIIPSDDPDELAKTINHEELHNLLNKEIGLPASIGLDSITIPRIMDKEGITLNPKTAGEITRTKDEVIRLVEQELKERGEWEGI